MTSSFAAELFKLRHRPAVWILGGILLALTVLLGYVIFWIVLSHPPAHAQFPPHYDRVAAKAVFYPQNVVRAVLGNGGAVGGGALCMILGVLAVGSEYGWETLKTVLTQRPSRLGSFFGRALAVTLLTLVFVVAVYIVAIIVGVILVSVDGRPLRWPDSGTLLKGLGATWLAYYIWASFGMMLAYLFRQSALAIGIGLVYMLLIEGLVINLLLPLGDWVKDVQRVLPGPATTALGNAFGQAYTTPGAPVTLLMDGTRATITLLICVVVFTAVGALVLVRRDVT
ncbi:MAG TPA: ABC transporter permease [Candidatus Acidoferrales bacterium]|nr:ABC transporter permease [Candidatus Acidoferrales bacterium]